MSWGTVTLENVPLFFQKINPTSSTGIQSQLLAPAIRSGTAQAGETTSITLKSGESAYDDTYVGWTLKTTGGTGSGQSRVITAYVGSTLIATVPTGVDLDNTTTYELIPPTILQCREVFITVETYQVRFRIDGVAPTATVGHIIAAGGTATIKGIDAIKNLRFIDTASGASTVWVSLYY